MCLNRSSTTSWRPKYRTYLFVLVFEDKLNSKQNNFHTVHSHPELYVTSFDQEVSVSHLLTPSYRKVRTIQFWSDPDLDPNLLYWLFSQVNIMFHSKMSPYGVSVFTLLWANTGMSLVLSGLDLDMSHLVRFLYDSVSWHHPEGSNVLVWFILLIIIRNPQHESGWGSGNGELVVQLQIISVY